MSTVAYHCGGTDKTRSKLLASLPLPSLLMQAHRCRYNVGSFVLAGIRGKSMLLYHSPQAILMQIRHEVHQQLTDVPASIL